MAARAGIVVPGMKTIFFVLCPIPATCLLLGYILYYLGWGGSQIQILSLTVAGISSAILTLIGLAWTMFSREENLKLLLATTIACLPGILITFAFMSHKGPHFQN
jgi:hypothetical protein